jgi:hypothetical protein
MRNSASLKALLSKSDAMPKDPRIKALANAAAVKIKALTDTHHQQIEAIYQDFREQAAEIQQSNADSLDGSSATPESIASDQHQQGNHHDTK